MKGILSMESSPYTVFEDFPVRSFKHHSLAQDYQELEQDTEATKERLERAKLKKLTLLAEVSFLRRRYKFLMKSQLANPQSKQDQVQKKNLMNRSKNTRKQNYNSKEAGLPPLVPRFNTNQKGRIFNGKKSTSTNQSPSFDLNLKDRVSIRKEDVLLNSAPTLDLNQNVMGARETDYPWKEGRKMAPVFDLNQISREEEEFQFDGEPLRIEEVHKSSFKTFSEEQNNDMKLSVCRTTGNGSNRAGKRKISWQDQVALRV